ncbi:DUF3488 and transglutaminase-like domain-containing protein [Bailinhaonella thermotolerans]|uniref:DUF3488 domain-containing protein n=1 Tax=Bailinhaonella thermotolerans TaxID=1070861 RepID=A0A3A4AZU9_9ACTN|nr:DUF3488 and transglutaminase-like domain-containing protein [Bailinhaonella thermotolerans]RJL34109.1 DUF3488 domain-containing protein [Bailinhaonella thermotolerans]
MTRPALDEPAAPGRHGAPAARHAAAHDPAAHDPAGHDPAAHDPAAHDPAAHDAGHVPVPGRGRGARRSGRGPGADVAGIARRGVELTLVAAVAGVAGLAFHRVFAIGELAPVAGIAAVSPVIVAAACARLPLWASLPVSALAWLLAACLGVFRAAPAPATLGAVGAGLRDSWKGLLTTILPAPPEPRLLVFVHVLVWIAAAIGAEAVLRSRAAALPVLPALGVFAAALVYGVGGPGSNVLPAAGLAAAAVPLLLARAGRPLWWLAPAVPAAAALGLVASLAGPRLPVAAEPYDPREHVEAPPPVKFDSVSPLDRVSAWLLNPEQELFTVRASAPANWRLAVLDRYDGLGWSSSARFQVTGGRVPPAAPGEETIARHDTVEQEVTIRRLPGSWLPAADRPVAVSGVTVSADAGSGMLVAAERPREGTSYRVTSSVPRPSAAELRAAVPASDEEARAALALPGDLAGRPAPQVDKFRRLAQKATDGARFPTQQAIRLQNFLRKHAKNDVTAPPGHSYRIVEDFLEFSRRGTAEQFSTAFALMARTLGLPSRVAVGFRPGAAEGGAHRVRAGDVLVWPEIKFERLGWVPFYPTPGRANAKEDHEVPQGATKERQDLEKKVEDSASSDAPPPREKSAEEESAESAREDSFPWWQVAAGAVAALLAAYGGAALLLPYLRRRRRRGAADPAGRVAGAWAQTREELRRLDVAASPALSAAEVAALASEALGPEAGSHLRPLADLVNDARFAPAPPTPAAAATAWTHADALGRLSRRAAGPLRRLRHRLSPRSLRL